MFSYIIKRVLIMIPTFFGVSMAIWLVMVMAPGRPTSRGGGGGQGAGADPGGKMEGREGRNVSERIFRDQFGLNRPLFWNNWVGLEKAEMQALIRTVLEGKQKHSISDIGEATEALEDFDRYAVPPLLELLEETSGAEQDAVLGWLRASAFQYPPLLQQGKQRSEDELARDRKINLENKRLDSAELNWQPGASEAERNTIVASWKAWWSEKKGSERWTYLDSATERLGLRIGDTQFGKYWKNLLSFDFGKSFKSNEPVTSIILSKMKYSLSLAVPSFLIAWILAVLLGVMGAANHNKPIDQGSAVFLFMLYSIPSFLMGTVLQKWLAVDMGWFPSLRWESVDAHKLNTWEQLKDVLYHLWLPLLCYTYGSLAFISRQARSGMLEVMQSDFVRTAYAKGCSRQRVIWRHAVRNGMMPLITLLGTALPVLLAGSVVIESIFGIPGFGKAMLDAILNKDYNLVMGVALFSSVLTLIGLLIADILYAMVDPRVSYS
ncbi:MAG: ABC transporter permease [Planctomycetota bacterium]|nr:ABC transporter permease [Planctomycetota bacterium]